MTRTLQVKRARFRWTWKIPYLDTWAQSHNHTISVSSLSLVLIARSLWKRTIRKQNYFLIYTALTPNLCWCPARSSVWLSEIECHVVNERKRLTLSIGSTSASSLFTLYNYSVEKIQRIPSELTGSSQTWAKCHKLSDKTGPKRQHKIKIKCHLAYLAGHIHKRWGDASGDLVGHIHKRSGDAEERLQVQVFGVKTVCANFANSLHRE